MKTKTKLPEATLNDQDSDRYEKLMEDFDLQGDLSEVLQFLEHLEDNYPIKNFSLHEYMPADPIGNDAVPIFFGRWGTHSANIYLALCYTLATGNINKDLQGRIYKKLIEFCWHEIKRIEEDFVQTSENLMIEAYIFLYIEKLILAGAFHRDLQLLTKAYNKFIEKIDYFDNYEAWNRNLLSGDSFIVVFEALIRETIGDKIASINKVIVRHPKMFRAFTDAIAYALDDEPCLIIGETGTGKEPIAKCIHAFSGRVKNPFKSLNCGGITETLFNSTIHGHVKGAFTDAKIDKQGLFLDANKGTLFLDEINSLPLSSQASLLRIIQFGEVQPVGNESNTKKANVRVICAVNKDPIQLINENKFREDLYYRIAMGVINVPPLRELKDTLEQIIDSFMVDLCKGKKPPKLKAKAMKKLRQYDWPGNFRELNSVLYNALKRMTINNDTVISESHIQGLLKNTVKKTGHTKRDYSDISYPELRREYLEYIHKKTNGNTLQAEKLTKISRKAITTSWKDYGLPYGRNKHNP